MEGEGPMEAPEDAVDEERLARRIDSGSSMFLFGYTLRALEAAAGIGRTRVHRPDDAGRARQAAEALRLLESLEDTASRTAALEPLRSEIADVARLARERAGPSGCLEAGMAPLLAGCARRWFRRVRELSRGRSSLAVDIAFNLELAGFGEVAARLYEAIICLEAGAFRASRLMSGLALDSALDGAGAPGGAPGDRMEWARRAGLVTSADVRQAAASITRAEEADAASAEWALGASVRLARKLLRSGIEEALLRAALPGGRAGPVR